MGMKTFEETKRHFEEATTVVPTRYEEGVRRAEWHDRAVSDEAEANFNAKMTEVLSKKLRKKGIEKVSDEDWRNSAINKGKPIIGARMKDAVSKYDRNFRPFYEVIKTTVEGLPAKGVDPMANIDARLKPLVEALVKKKEELRG